jgi:UDP-N-acetylmuramate dehydrogenase
MKKEGLYYYFMLSYKTNVPLAPLTTMHVGGPARYFTCVRTLSELKEAFLFSQKHNLSVFILGGGSNILVGDGGYDGVVVKIELSGVEFFEKENGFIEVVVGAGECWDDFVNETVRRGFYGLENLSGIPGTVGAAPIQNIGAYGVEVKNSILWVEVFDPKDAESKVIQNNECDFAYRDSFFKTSKGKHLVVTKVCFCLERDGILNTAYKDIQGYFQRGGGGRPTLRSIRKAILSIRSKKFPNIQKVGTAGSFFKNPIVSEEKACVLSEQFPDMPQFPVSLGVKIPIAWILDHALSWKGKREGAIGVYPNHSLVLVNYGGGTVADIESFARKIQTDVKEKVGIDIEREVTTVN